MKYEELSTQELNELLREDVEQERLSEDDILDILQILEQRIAEEKGKTAQQAWQSFVKYYMP